MRVQMERLSSNKEIKSLTVLTGKRKQSHIPY